MRGWPVSRILSQSLRSLDDHSSANRVATAVKLPTRTPGLKVPCRGLRRCGPYDVGSLFGIAPGGACHTVLVAKTVVGSYPTVSPSPWIRPTQASNTKADSSLWRFPWGCPRRALPGTLLSWSPDFPRVSPRSSSHPRESGDRRKRGLVQGLSSWLRLGLVGASSGLAADGGFTPPAPVGYLRTEDANFRKIRQKLPRRAPRPHRPGRGHPPSRGLAPMAGSAGETR